MRFIISYIFERLQSETRKLCLVCISVRLYTISHHSNMPLPRRLHCSNTSHRSYTALRSVHIIIVRKHLLFIWISFHFIQVKMITEITWCQVGGWDDVGWHGDYGKCPKKNRICSAEQCGTGLAWQEQWAFTYLPLHAFQMQRHGK